MSALREWAAERGITVHVSFAGKAKTAVQLTSLTVLLACRALPSSPGHAEVVAWAAKGGVLLLAISALLALASAAEYARGVVRASGTNAEPR